MRKWLFVVTILLSGCDNHEPYDEINRLEYKKDKYGICYATYKLGRSNESSITAVPCGKVGL